MANQRPAIPTALQNEVRRKCNGRCVMCGKMMTQIDHIIEYNIVKEHKIENLTLLCNMHHALKTKGQLGSEVVKERTENIKHIDTQGNPDINFKIGSVILGNNVIETGDILIFQVEDRDYLGCRYNTELGRMVFNAAFYDKDGEIAFKITENIYDTAYEKWDVIERGKKRRISEYYH